MSVIYILFALPRAAPCNVALSRASSRSASLRIAFQLATRAAEQRYHISRRITYRRRRIRIPKLMATRREEGETRDQLIGLPIVAPAGMRALRIVTRSVALSLSYG